MRAILGLLASINPVFHAFTGHLPSLERKEIAMGSLDFLSRAFLHIVRNPFDSSALERFTVMEQVFCNQLMKPARTSILQKERITGKSSCKYTEFKRVTCTMHYSSM